MIEINGLSKSYKGSGRLALDSLSLTVNDGEIFGFLGPNGAGKSTAIKCMTGILSFTQGTVKICGVDMNVDPVGAKKKIGYVPDEHLLYEGVTGRQYVNFISDIFGVDKSRREELTKKYADEFGLSDRLDETISNYSHGMKQKIAVIAALVHEPDVFILDEPMLGLDPKSAYVLKKTMREYADNGKTVFFSSHILEVVEKICDRVAIIDGGKLIAVCDIQELKEKRSDMSLEQLFLTLTGGEDAFKVEEPIATISAETVNEKADNMTETDEREEKHEV